MLENSRHRESNIGAISDKIIVSFDEYPIFSFLKYKKISFFWNKGRKKIGRILKCSATDKFYAQNDPTNNCKITPI